MRLSKSPRGQKGGIYLVDTADSETKGASLDPCPIHVVANHEYELKVYFRQNKHFEPRTYIQNFLEVLGMQ